MYHDSQVRTMHDMVKCSPVFSHINNHSSFQKCSSSHKLVILVNLFFCLFCYRVRCGTVTLF